MRMGLRSLRTGEVHGIIGVGVKSVYIDKNTKCEGKALGAT